MGNWLAPVTLAWYFGTNSALTPAVDGPPGQVAYLEYFGFRTALFLSSYTDRIEDSHCSMGKSAANFLGLLEVWLLRDKEGCKSC